MAANVKSFLGTGWSFPPTFKKSTCSVELVSDVRDIEQSLIILLGTSPGERLMHPKFGCNLRKFVFERADASVIAEMSDMIALAINTFEPRVQFLGVEVVEKDDLEGILSINVSYKITITNTRHNIVFPFYKLEGTNIQSQLVNPND